MKSESVDAYFFDNCNKISHPLYRQRSQSFPDILHYNSLSNLFDDGVITYQKFREIRTARI